MLEIEDHDGIELFRIRHGKVNAIDTELLEGLRDGLAEVQRRGARAVVLTGFDSVFSAGVDLFKVLDGGSRYVSDLLPALSIALRELVAFPRPLVAAINGHAIAGGCILACACDYKMMAAGSGRIGVPELLVGVPFPAVPLEILRMVVPRRHLQEVVLLGRTYGPEEGRDRGLVDEVVPARELQARSLAVAAEMAAIESRTFELGKRQLRRPHLDAMDLNRQLFDGEVEAHWQDLEAHERIRAYLARTLGKK